MDKTEANKVEMSALDVARTNIARSLVQYKSVQKLIEPYIRQTLYAIGLFGRGATVLDIEPPEFKPTWVQQFVWWFFIPSDKLYRVIESEFRQALWAEIIKDI